MKPYTTIRQQTEAVIVIKHSRFIATAMPVADYDDALAKVAALKKKYADATHNCYAFVADEMGMQCKFSDDGEPSGTAGTPMLEVLRRQGVGHVLVVVTRYFGGIKLGASGLVGAYSAATAEALSAAEKVQMVYSSFCRIRVDYALGGKLTAYVQKEGGVVREISYDEGVCARVVVPVEREQSLSSSLVEYTKGAVDFAVESNGYWGYV